MPRSAQHTPRLNLRLVAVGLLAPAMWGSLSAHGRDAGTGVGFLVSAAPAEILDLESDLACEVVQRLTSASVFMPAGNGRFVDCEQRDVSLDRFRVIWCHQGDRGTRKDRAWDPQIAAALRRFAENGHGLLLSGEAAALVAPIGLDTLRAQPVRADQDRGRPAWRRSTRITRRFANSIWIAASCGLQTRPSRPSLSSPSPASRPKARSSPGSPAGRPAHWSSTARATAA